MFYIMHRPQLGFFFFFNDTATTEIYTLSYTTLFRSLRPVAERCLLRPRRARQMGARDWRLRRLPCRSLEDPGRSEEHTSELQSQSNLVCRLLLEKKKSPHPRLRHQT